MGKENLKPTFEVRTVAHTYAPYRKNSEPNVKRLPDGNLLAVWAAQGEKWTSEEKVAGSFSLDNGVRWSKPTVLHSNTGRNCTDPLLLVTDNEVLLSYNESPPLVPGPKSRTFLFKEAKRMLKVSKDNGKTWSQPVRLNTGHSYCGARHNGLKLSDGTLIIPFYWVLECEEKEITEGEMTSVSSVMRSKDNGETWIKGEDIYINSPGGADEPAVVELTNGDLYMLFRTRTGYQYQAWSKDQGETWSKPIPSALASLSAPSTLYRVSFKPSKIIVAWDNSLRERVFFDSLRKGISSYRYPLDVAISYDDCKTWIYSGTISSPGCQVSYPGITMSSDGLIVVVYQQWPETLFRDVSDIKSDIKCARFSEEWIKLSPFVSPRVS